jgi:hypothetical protein
LKTPVAFQGLLQAKEMRWRALTKQTSKPGRSRTWKSAIH